jgi:putative ABC transport system substrate-binding protein
MTNVADAVGGGFVAALNRPGGNTTGFSLLEPSLGGKWLELLSEIAPDLKRVAMMFNADTGPVSVYKRSFEMAAQSLKIEPMVQPIHNDVEIEASINKLGREPGLGLVVPPGGMFVHRVPLISAAARNNVPAIYWLSDVVRGGGLLSYGVDLVDIYRRAATYVDGILRGAKPAEQPVQLPTKFEMAVNLKTAKALGLAVPPSIRLLATEVIE